MNAEPQSSESTITNLEEVEELYEAKKEKEREEIQDAEEALTTEQWLESELNEQSNTVEIYGRDFEFRPIGSKTVEDVTKLFGDEVENLDIDADNPQDIDPDDLEDSAEDIPKTMWTLRHELADHCIDEEMDADAFGRIPPQDLVQIFERAAASLTPDDAERAKRFR
jgi:hypothetical protein